MSPGALRIFAAVVLAVWSVVTLARAVPEATKFVFEVPDGWTDVSPGAPEDNFRNLPAETFLDVKANRFAAIAVDKAHAGDGFGESMTAFVAEGTQAITDTVLAEAAAAMAKAKGTDVRESEVIHLGGVAVGRMVTDKRVAGRHTTSLVLLMPGDGEHAVLTYTAAAETFEEYLPVFEGAARATRGLATPPAPKESRASPVAKRIAWFALGGLAMAILAIVLLRRRGRADG